MLASEWEAWRALRLRALRDTPSAFGSTYELEITFPDDEWRSRTARLAESDDRALFVAEVGSGLVGSAALFEDAGGVRHLIAMWVAPEARRLGVGRALVAAAVEHARAGGAAFVRLHVVVDNEAAHRLYLAAGFVATGNLIPLPRDPSVLEREMELALSS